MAAHVVAWNPRAHQPRPASPAYCPVTRGPHRYDSMVCDGCVCSQVCLECAYEDSIEEHVFVVEFTCPIFNTRIERCTLCPSYRRFIHS